MKRFHSLEVLEVRQETEDCVSVAFKVPQELKKDFEFLPGQYLTLKTMIAAEEVRRSYSICTGAGEDLRVAIKEVEDGKFSTFANSNLKKGDFLDVMTPMGNFTTEIKPQHAKFYTAFAAGSGITPIMSLMKTILATEPKSQFVLFYGNKRSQDVIFLEEIEGLKNKYLGRLTVHYVLSREDNGSDLFYGRIDKKRCQIFCEKLIPLQSVDEFFLCGPEEMTLDCKSVLEKNNVPAKRIHFELFTTPNQKKTGTKNKKTKKSKNIAATVVLTLDTLTYTFDLDSAGETILDAAARSGADVPYACKGGVCCTCKAKVLEGEVEMDVNYALVPEQVEAGYILTCQSHPKTKKVVISFDE